MADSSTAPQPGDRLVQSRRNPEERRRRRSANGCSWCWAAPPPRGPDGRPVVALGRLELRFDRRRLCGCLFRPGDAADQRQGHGGAGPRRRGREEGRRPGRDRSRRREFGGGAGRSRLRHDDPQGADLFRRRRGPPSRLPAHQARLQRRARIQGTGAVSSEELSSVKAAFEASTAALRAPTL